MRCTRSRKDPPWSPSRLIWLLIFRSRLHELRWVVSRSSPGSTPRLESVFIGEEVFSAHRKQGQASLSGWVALRQV